MSRKVGSSAWSSVLCKALPVSLVGAHLTAAVLGLYTSAPDVTIIQPAREASGSNELVIEVRADDGPKGSGVRGVEYQLDSTLGTWRPLSLDSRSMTYKATWKPVGVAEGSHELYVRATDNTGNSRKAYVTVKVTHAPTPSNEVREPVPSEEGSVDLSLNGLGPATLAASGAHPRG